MGGHPSTAIPCTICRKLVDLTVDLCADENGVAIHEDCYVKHVTSNEGQSKLGGGDSR
jgi:hypothetical protein